MSLDRGGVTGGGVTGDDGLVDLGDLDPRRGGLEGVVGQQLALVVGDTGAHHLGGLSGLPLRWADLSPEERIGVSTPEKRNGSSP